MVNLLGLLLLILVVVIAWRLWSSGVVQGSGIIGGGKKSEKVTESKLDYKEFQSYTITEDGHFVRASFSDNAGKRSILVLYNNGSRDKDGKVVQGDVQIGFKVEDGALDKENAKTEGLDKLSDHGKEVINRALESLKNRMDDATSKAIKEVLDFAL